ncbi:MAG: DUF349 domain-containing protein, partial [Pseudohongiellaceae bacterium]
AGNEPPTTPDAEAVPADAGNEPPATPETASSGGAGAVAETLEQLAAELDKASHKNSTTLNNLRRQLRTLARQSDPDSDVGRRSAQIKETLDGLLARNLDYQKQLQQRTTELLATLKTALEAGQSEQALPTWDRIQGNISNTSGKARRALQNEANKYKAEVLKLRDWKIFASTEKKKELLGRMQALPAAALPPPQLSKRIREMHKEWQALGRSHDNESLWKQFKTLSDAAYEPCKTYFRERKQLMAQNLVRRRELCEALDAELAQLDSDNIDVAALGRLLKESDATWKQNAPVEQAKIKPLQKRYFGIVNRLRKLRKAAIRHNAAAKQALVDRATQLCALDDNRQAMAEARELQKAWQALGPTTFKDDKTLWTGFRAACDQIFGKQREQTEQMKTRLRETESRLDALLNELEGLLRLDDEALRQARSHYQALLQDFSAALDPQLRKSGARFVDRCNDLKRRIQARLSALPDKKQQALQEAVAARVAPLLELEEKLLASADAGAFAAALAEFDTAAWQSLDATGNKAIDAQLAQRCTALTAAGSAQDLASVQRDAVERLRDLCIEVEIRADVSTPASEQGRRMELQLAQLKEAFGQSKPTRQDTIRFAQEAELMARCVGPLAEAERDHYLGRLRQALQKLIRP